MSNPLPVASLLAIVRGHSQGVTHEQLALDLECHPGTVSRWVERLGLSFIPGRPSLSRTYRLQLRRIEENGGLTQMEDQEKASRKPGD